MGNGSPMQREGLAIHLYACNADMGKTAFVNSDGDFLIVPVHGRLDIQTEFGKCVGPRFPYMRSSLWCAQDDGLPRRDCRRPARSQMEGYSP